MSPNKCETACALSEFCRLSHTNYELLTFQTPSVEEIYFVNMWYSLWMMHMLCHELCGILFLSFWNFVMRSVSLCFHHQNSFYSFYQLYLSYLFRLVTFPLPVIQHYIWEIFANIPSLCDIKNNLCKHFNCAFIVFLSIDWWFSKWLG